MSEPPVRVGPDGPDAHPRKTGANRLDLTLALAAIFISGVSLYVAIEHGKTERDLVAANSWPFLRATVSNVYGPDLSLAVGYSNGGVGPAKVKTYELFYRGVPVPTALALLQRCCGLASDPARIKQQLARSLLTSSASEQVVRAGEDNPVVQLRRDAPDAALLPAFNQALRELTFRACYCSVFDRCWTTNLTTTDVTPVKVCPTPKVPFSGRG
jgi:hypothetical protein